MAKGFDAIESISFDAFFCKMNHLRGLWGKLNDMIHVKFSIQWLIYIRHNTGERYYYYWNKGKKKEEGERVNRYLSSFSKQSHRKPEWTFWPTQQMCR